jgi:hypothetical protein
LWALVLVPVSVLQWAQQWALYLERLLVCGWVRVLVRAWAQQWVFPVVLVWALVLARQLVPALVLVSEKAWELALVLEWVRESGLV